MQLPLTGRRSESNSLPPASAGSHCGVRHSLRWPSRSRFLLRLSLEWCLSERLAKAWLFFAPVKMPVLRGFLLGSFPTTIIYTHNNMRSSIKINLTKDFLWVSLRHERKTPKDPEDRKPPT